MHDIEDGIEVAVITREQELRRKQDRDLRRRMALSVVILAIILSLMLLRR